MAGFKVGDWVIRQQSVARIEQLHGKIATLYRLDGVKEHLPVEDIKRIPPIHLQELTLSHKILKFSHTVTLIKTRHILLTGPNGSGKSTCLAALQVVFEGNTPNLVKTTATTTPKLTYLTQLIRHKRTAFCAIPAQRNFKQINVEGPKHLDLSSQVLRSNFMQYLVNRRTAQAYAFEAGHQEETEKHRSWFSALEQSLSELFDLPSIKLQFDPTRFRFSLTSPNQTEPIPFDSLPDGYSSILSILSELILQDEACVQRWGVPSLGGLALIDELEAHLHLELQAKILPILTRLFPHYQFIIATHSPVILSSIPDAVILDLGTGKQTLSKDLMGKPFGVIMQGHFGLDSDLDEDTTRLRKEWYELLKLKKAGTLGESTARFEELTGILKSRSATLAREVWMELEL
jgi:energy-coupling factor transporter ATP-binding protein EcfA2